MSNQKNNNVIKSPVNHQLRYKKQRQFLFIVFPLVLLVLINVYTVQRSGLAGISEHFVKEWDEEISYLMYGSRSENTLSNKWQDLNKVQLNELISNTPKFDEIFLTKCDYSGVFYELFHKLNYLEFWGAWTYYTVDWENICIMTEHYQVENRLDPNFYFVKFGDSIEIKGLNIPLMTKARHINQTKSKVLSPPILVLLEWSRHWRWTQMSPLTNIPWNKKINELVWRGATTGNGMRLDYVKILSDQGHNVRFDKLKDQGLNWTQNIPHKYFGKSMHRRQMMYYKYALSLEGNDVATNLKWLMSHNSVIVMPTPTVETWLMEGLLQPYVHYVPLNDPRDINKVMIWLLKNDAKCQQIVQNANAWMKKFENADRSRYIHYNILRESSIWMKRQLDENEVKIEFEKNEYQLVDDQK